MIIMSAKLRPIITIVKEKAEVKRAIVVECGRSACDMRPPEDDATMRVTTGRSHVAVILLTEWSWRVILNKTSQRLALEDAHAFVEMCL